MSNGWVIAACCLGLGALFADNDFADEPLFAHAMGVEVREIDSLPTVFQYGEIRPDFEVREVTEGPRRSWLLDGEWSLRFEGQREAGLVEVPHSWGMLSGSVYWEDEDETFENPARYNGAGYYEKRFEVNFKTGSSYRLAFHGVRERARIMLNGKEIAQHEGVGAPFSVNVSDFLRDGENLLELKVMRQPVYRMNEEGEREGIKRSHSLYSKPTDYWAYAGITGSVVLWEEPLTTLRKVQVQVKGEHLQVRAFLQNFSEQAWQGQLALALEETEGELVSVSVKIGAADFSAFEVLMAIADIPGGLEAWSPNSPKLYHLSAHLLSEEDGLLVDALETRFGRREFRVAKEKLLLNKEPVFLKGVSSYCETERGAAVTREEKRQILSLAKEAGANFVRLPVRQRDPLTYQLADELGLMVSGEWGGFWYQEDAMVAQTEDSQSIYQSMGRVAVWDLMNRPSVVLWCTNNECDQFSKAYRPFLEMNRFLVRELDEGLLPITWAGWHPYQGTPHFDLADIVGFNEYRGSLDKFSDLLPDMRKVVEENSGKPIVIMENGAWSRLGRHGSSSRKGTEEWQASLIARQWEVLQDFPSLVGYTYWILKDYRSREPYTANRGSRGWSRMGLYSYGGESKLARDTFRDTAMEASREN